MACDMTDEIFRLHDGDLTGEEKARAERHLAACPECRRALDGWKSLSAVISSGAEIKASSEFTDAVMARIAPEPERGFFDRISDYVSLPKLALAGVLTAAFAIFLLRPLFVSPAASISHEGAAFVAELMSENSEQDSYNAASDYLFGS